MARDMSSILEHMAALTAAGTGLDEVDDATRVEKGDGEAGVGKGQDHPEDERLDAEGETDAVATDDPLDARLRPMEPDPLTRLPEQFAPDWRNGFFVVPRLPAVQGRSDDDTDGS